MILDPHCIHLFIEIMKFATDWIRFIEVNQVESKLESLQNQNNQNSQSAFINCPGGFKK